jgi:alpha-ribazole phosphatase
MEVYLVRHTETVCEKGVCYGQSDVQIKEPYGTVFQSIVSQLPTDAILYSSPLIRCSLLAEHILQNKEIDSISKDDRLMEMNFGDWELKNWNEIPRAILDPWMNDFVSVRVPNGESFIEVYDRVWDFMNYVKQNKPEKPIIIVTHSGVIRSILCKINNIPLQDAFKNTIDYGVVIKISI